MEEIARTYQSLMLDKTTTKVDSASKPASSSKTASGATPVSDAKGMRRNDTAGFVSEGMGPGHIPANGIGGKASAPKAMSKSQGSIAKGNLRARSRAPLLQVNIAGRGTAPLHVQFVREEIFAIARVRRPPDKKTGTTRASKSSASDVIGEATRATPEHYQHLTQQGLKPLPPRGLAGVAPEQLSEWFTAHCAAAQRNLVPLNQAGKVYMRRQSTTIPILLAAVASYPGRPDDDDEAYRVWREAVVTWAHKHYGVHLVSVVEHIDEPHGHVHILAALPDAMPVRALHSGWSAVDAARERGEDKSKLGEAYRQGCRQFQDLFFDGVGRPSGLDRLSPKPNDRYSYQTAMARKQLADEISIAEGVLADEKRDWEAHKTREQADLTTLIHQARERMDDAEGIMEEALRRAAEVAERKKEVRIELAAIALEKDRLAQDHAQLFEHRRTFETLVRDANEKLIGHRQAKEAAEVRANAIDELLEGYVRETTADEEEAKLVLSRLRLRAGKMRLTG